MATTHRWVLLAIATLMGATLGACSPKAPPPQASATAAEKLPDDFDWARAALTRNPNLQVLAADTDAKVITVRVRNTGEVRALKLADIAAAPISDLANAPAEPAPAPMPAESAPVTAPAPPANVVSPPTQVAAAKSKDPTAGYSIQRDPGHVKVTGPGVNIESASAGGTPGVPSTTTSRAEPIICDGKRAMYLDGQIVSLQGDAVIARNGCELHIANSNIFGSGNGIVVDNARVYVRNSSVEGGLASFESLGDAKLYLQNSTFKGASRRSEHTQIDDQGGNVWR
jgi:hypothetical protein